MNRSDDEPYPHDKHEGSGDPDEISPMPGEPGGLAVPDDQSRDLARKEAGGPAENPQWVVRLPWPRRTTGNTTVVIVPASNMVRGLLLAVLILFVLLVAIVLLGPPRRLEPSASTSPTPTHRSPTSSAPPLPVPSLTLSGSGPPPSTPPVGPSPLPPTPGIAPAPAIHYQGPLAIDEDPKDLDLDPPAKVDEHDRNSDLVGSMFSLEAVNGATMAFWQGRTLPTYSDCARIISAAGTSSISPDAGDIVCVLTSDQRLGRLKMVEDDRNNARNFDAVIWNKPRRT